MTEPTLRDWFAIHAPVEPWPDFEPEYPPRPDKPPVLPVGNDGEAPTEEKEKLLWGLLREDAWDVEFDYPEYSYWIAQWREYWAACREWEKACQRARHEQWPYYYADVMIRERSRWECNEVPAPKKLSRSQLIRLLDDIAAQVAASRGGDPECWRTED